MVMEDYTSKVGDFGLSRLQDSTKTMTMCGSPLWTSPEMLRSVKYDEKVDVYSLAIMFWEFFAWCEPYPSMPVFDITKGVTSGSLRPTIMKDMPKQYVLLMQDMWKQNPKDRPTMKEVVARLKDVIDNATGATKGNIGSTIHKMPSAKNVKGIRG